jgi:MoxR-like ATPase
METKRLTRADDLATYEPSPALIAVGKMALELGRPLLLAGKPGTGKTQFAHWLAKESSSLGFSSEPIFFSTKSTSVFGELFYQYDAVGHFRSKDPGKRVSDFIELTALGHAILAAKDPNKLEPEIAEIAQRTVKQFGVKSVVLIDEIDKAPRDFPNDLLNEIENLSFRIKEINSKEIRLEDHERGNVCIVLTSNFEKSLPDAFLRRCLFYYIEFPNLEQLAIIVKNKLKINDHDLPALKEKLVLIEKLYAVDAIVKKPGTSECIDWINWLYSKGLLKKSGFDLPNTLPILLKSEADQKAAIHLFS